MTVQATSVNILTRDQLYLDPAHDKSISVMIVQKVKSVTRLQSDAGDDYSLHATAYLGGDDYPKKEIWSIDVPAATGEIGDYFYHVSNPVQGDILPIHYFYNLKSGKLVYQGNTDLLSVIGKGQDRFLVMRIQYLKDGEFPSGVNAKTFSGLILYGDSTQVLHKLLITNTAAEDGPPEQPYLKLIDEGKPVMDGELMRDDVKRFDVLVTLGEVSFHIPFGTDGPKLDDVKDLPKGYSVKLLD